MEGTDYLLVKPDRSIVFPAMDYFTSAVRKASMLHQGVPVVIDLSAVTLADFSTAYVRENWKALEFYTKRIALRDLTT